MRIAGEGEIDPSVLLIFRALRGSSGKVEIGRRRYTFSCIPIFRLTDEESGLTHDCRDSSTLLDLIQSLQRERRAGRLGACKES